MRRSSRSTRLVAAAAGSSAVLAAVVLAASALSSPAVAAAAAKKSCSLKGQTVGFVSILNQNPTVALWQAGAEAGAKAVGANFKAFTTPTANEQEAVSLGEQAVAQGVKYLDMIPFDPSWYPLVTYAKAHGVPTAVTHVPVPKSVGAAVDVVTDVPAYARYVADTIGSNIGGKGTVALTQESFNTTENLIMKTFVAEMHTRYPAVKIDGPTLEGSVPAQEIAHNAALLEANPKIVAAYSSTSGGGVSWTSAAKETHRKLMIIAMDYIRPNLELIKSGQLFGVVGQPLFQENEEGVEALCEIAHHQHVPYLIQPPAPLVTKANVSQYFALLKSLGQ
jgi:ribose transport system substrate-binding protein